MISFPQSANTTELSYFYQREQNTGVSAVKEQDGRSVSVSASSSSTVTISGQFQRSHTFLADGVAKYEAISDEPPKTTTAASNILSFIALRLEQDIADGATEEEIASRLQAGYEGFVKGYQEAFEQLAGAGLLSPEVEEAISQTYDDVLAGIDELAEKYGVASPLSPAKEVEDSDEALADVDDAVEVSAPAQPEVQAGNQSISSGVDGVNVASPQQAFAKFADQAVNPVESLTSMINASTVNYESFASRSFDFSLKTQDGDTITISASASRGEEGRYSQVNYASAYENYSAGRVVVDSYESSAFNIQVEGELDEDELAAINDLLNQIGNLSEEFFSGNIQEAFEMALEIGFDESEIAQFSLDLKQESYTKVEAAYAEVQNLPSQVAAPAESAQDAVDDNHKLKQLARFVEMLQDMASKADQLGVDRDMIPKFADYLAENVFADKPNADKLAPMLDKMVYQDPVE